VAGRRKFWLGRGTKEREPGTAVGTAVGMIVRGATGRPAKVGEGENLPHEPRAAVKRYTPLLAEVSVAAPTAKLLTDTARELVPNTGELVAVTVEAPTMRCCSDQEPPFARKT